MQPATIQNAACDGSPGTTMSIGLRFDGRTRMTRPPPSDATVMSAPASASISSVWARVGTGSWTIVSPFADMPASRIADFTCALATGGVHSMPVSAPPTTSIGGRHCFPSPQTVEPIAVNGSAMRSIGRDDSELSPNNVVDPSSPATTPASSRIAVPEFPQSTGLAAAWRRPPLTVTVAPSRVHRRAELDNRGERARARRRRRRARGRRTCRQPARRRSRARWDTDLSPGVRTVPRSGPRATNFTPTSSRRKSRRHDSTWTVHR